MSLVPGERRFNWVWYVNYNQTTELLAFSRIRRMRRDYSVPPGMLAPAVEMRSYADMVLAPRSRSCGNSEPFVQAILDLGVPQMTFDGSWLCCLIPRPHCRQYVKSRECIALADALIQYNHDVRKALPALGPLQLAYGKQLIASGQQLGNRSVQLRNRSEGDTLWKSQSNK